MKRTCINMYREVEETEEPSVNEDYADKPDDEQEEGTEVAGGKKQHDREPGGLGAIHHKCTE